MHGPVMSLSEIGFIGSAEISKSSSREVPRLPWRKTRRSSVALSSASSYSLSTLCALPFEESVIAVNRSTPADTTKRVIHIFLGHSPLRLEREKTASSGIFSKAVTDAFNGHSQLIVLLQLVRNLLVRVHDGRMVPVSQLPADGLITAAGMFACQIDGDGTVAYEVLSS